MNNSDTLDKLREMKFFGMFHTFKAQLDTGNTEKYTPDQFLAELVEAEYEDRVNRRINRLIDAAKFRYKGSIEDINFHRDRSIDRNQIMRLAECGFIEKHEDVLITGPTGIGKSYIASALGYQACAKEYKVLYWSTPKLFTRLKQAKADNSYIKEMARIEKAELLILDDFGLHPLDATSRAMLMDIIEDRHDKMSLIITSQLPVKDWYNIIGEKTIADAVLDRIVHSAHRIDATGESMRKTRPKKTEENNYE
ncbi:MULTISPECIES: IS21-like element helper ATPase IstB [Pedobacter]|uniref:DNA replication protein DnaC n=2 Tax=Pedobacter TaxID=84567 RepID=A0A318UWV9_9SPHI|nr:MULTISPECIES: IS21-like element helper ATPase IstB [Pedobacter]PYF76139.1 DNA replication protein DnaC [Pedobacter nutrimenti]TKC07487.1 ATP-binding protein [Pedobacter frigoris]